MQGNVTYQIAALLISIIGLVLTYFVVPWMQSKVSNEKMSLLKMWVQVAVAAAEQLFKMPGMGEEKKKHVVEFLQSKGITITDQELDALIEAAVFEINKSKELLFKDLALSSRERINQA